MSVPPVERIAALQQLIADFGAVERMPRLPGSGRRENDNDHSFGLALTCWYLQPKVAPGLDLLEIFKYALAHDLVELYAGDSFAFDKKARAGKEGREKAAIDRLKNEWFDFSEMPQFAKQYMERASEEARFVKAVDKLLPPLMIELSKAKEWERLEITLADERENKTNIHVSAYMSPYYELLLQWLDEQGTIPKS